MYKAWKSVFFTALLTAVLIGIASAASADTLTLPSGLKTIEAEAFMGDTSLDEVILPEGLESIGENAFANSSVKRIYLPESLTDIADDAFAGCTNVVGYGLDNTTAGRFFDTHAGLIFELEESITSPLEDFFFSALSDSTCELSGHQRGKQNNVIVPSQDSLGRTVISIGEFAFYRDDSLISVKLPNSVVSIEKDAFSNCSNLKEVIIPDSVTTISEWAFQGCTSMQSVDLPYNLMVIGERAFYNCTSLSSVHFPNNPDGITAISKEAFANCTSLQSIDLPDSITIIGQWAFRDCSSLARIHFSDNLLEIDANAFENCIKLAEIQLPNSLIKVDSFAFRNCKGPESIFIPENLVNIGNGAFICPNLKSFEVAKNNLHYTTIDGVLIESNSNLSIYPAGKEDSHYTIPDQVDCIDVDAFACCQSLKSVYISKDIRTIFSGSFRSCPRLTDFIVSPENLYFSAQDGILFNLDQTELVSYPSEKMNNAFHIPDSVSVLKYYAFSGCEYLKTVYCPKNIKHCSHAFVDCSGLSTVCFANGFSKIDSFAFFDCHNLINVYLPDTVNEIGDYAFYRCENVTIYGIAGSYAQTWANEHNIPFSTDPMPGMETEPETVLTGSFSEEAITISLGEKRQLGGIVSSSGADIKRVTLTIGGYDVPDDESDRYTFDDFSDHHMKEVNMQYWAAFTLDTTREPLNVPGTYTVKLWARADGMENGELLDSMEVTVTNEESALNCVLNQSDISVKLGEAVLLKATVESDLLSIHQIRLTVDNWLSENGDNVYSYDDFTALSLKKVDLQDWLAFQIDTDESPFDEPGIYSVNLEANVMGQDGYTQLGVLNVTVSGNSDIKPLITYPAIDHDEVPFGSIDVSWQEVPNAQYYMMSLRDLETKELLLYHSNVGTETSALLSNAYFSPDRDYRMAIGAVMGTDENGNDAVRWCERVFHVMPEEEETGEGILIVQVYQAEGIETNVTSRGIKLVPRTSSNPQGVENCKIIVSYFDEAANAEVIEREMYTDANGTCQMTCNEGNKFTISYVKEGMTFFTAYDPVVIHAGQNVITNYAYLKGYQVSVDTPYQDIPQKRPKGLYAEYFEQTGKNSSFTAENKLNEAVLEGPLSYRWKVISKGDYYQLNQYAFEDNNFSSLVSTINFVPEKFAAMFSGFIQLGGNGTGNNESGRPYKFRLTGDDGVYLEIEANQYLSKHDEDWGSGSSNTATVNLQQNLFKDGTVVRLYVKYYNTWGSANLKLEYSHDVDKSDSKSQWFVVPGEWLYAGTRQVYITGNTGMQSYYKLRQATVEKQLENYDKKTVKEFIDDLINSTFGSVVDEGFQNLLDGLGLTDQNSFIQKMIRQTADNVENKLTRSIYGAVSKKLAGTDESNKALWQEIYEDIANELKINVSDIDLKDIFNKDTFDAFLAYGQIKKYAEAHTVLQNTFWTDLNCITALYVAGGSDNIKDADELYPMRNLGMLAFLETEAEDISKKQQQFVEDVQAASAEAKGAISLAKKGFNLIKELHKDANKCAATLTLLYAENGSKWTEEFIKAAMQNESTSDLLYNYFLSDDFTTRAGFEKLLIQKNGKSIAANLASLQGVNLEKVLYQEVLVMTMDTVKNYYVKMGKGLLK